MKYYNNKKQKRKSLSLIFYSDPRHGWLEVELNTIKELGISKNISHCSYQNNKYAYLEEDLDANIFLDACKAAEFLVEQNEIHLDPCFIRRLNPYTQL